VDVRDLVISAKARGLHFWIDGEKVRVEAACEPDAETIAILQRLRTHREELRRILDASKQPIGDRDDSAEALAVSVLAENKGTEVDAILRCWERIIGLQLDADRVKSHLADLRRWKSR
jgi:hypothetical protein